MQIVEFGRERARPIRELVSTRAATLSLGSGTGEAHVYAVRVERSGRIEEHVADFGQLFLVIEGAAWVCGGDGRRVELTAGQGAYVERGELHAKGSDSGMTAIMIQVRNLTPAAESLRG